MVWQHRAVDNCRWVATYRAWDNAETPVRFPVDMVAPDPARR